MYWRKIAFVWMILEFGAVAYLYGQNEAPRYWIGFTDKTHTPYSVTEPEAFLSQRAIERRTKLGIPVTEEDLPVDPAYIDSLIHLDIQVINVSKWFNGAIVAIREPEKLNLLEELEFVKDSFILLRPEMSQAAFKTSASKLEISGKPVNPQYGPSYNQVEMLGGDLLHAAGFKGQGMLIGILDAGFTNADSLSSLQPIWQDGRIVAVRDFVKDGKDIFNSHNHGSQVFSIIGGMAEGILYGTAPGAEFALIRTEDGASEYLVEEYNWLCGIEFADSLGAQVINSSLGYSLFDDSLQNHTYADMDGLSTPISRAASIAATKGMIIVTSAGNSGDDDWYYITAPADATGILAVGATDSTGVITAFSSHGPSYDGRIKPDVCAQGRYTVSQHSGGTFTYCTGTSCSSPVITGMMACLWQSQPEEDPARLIQYLIRNSSQYLNPDGEYGYGIPNFVQTNFMLQNENILPVPGPSGLTLFPNPVESDLYISIRTGTSGDATGITLRIMDTNGRLLYIKEGETEPGWSVVKLADLDFLADGFYIVTVTIGDEILSAPFTKK